MTVTDVLPAHVDVCPQNVEKSIVVLIQLILTLFVFLELSNR